VGDLYLLKVPGYTLIRMDDDFYKLLKFAAEEHKKIFRLSEKRFNYYVYLDKKRAFVDAIRSIKMNATFIDEVPEHHSDIFLATSWPVTWVIIFFREYGGSVKKLKYSVHKKEGKLVLLNEKYMEVCPIEEYKGVRVSKIIESPTLIYFRQSGKSKRYLKSRGFL